MRAPSTYPRLRRRFVCQACGCDVERPESDRFDDSICLNCWYGRVRGEDRAEIAA
jgi:hypothetical protein